MSRYSLRLMLGASLINCFVVPLAPAQDQSATRVATLVSGGSPFDGFKHFSATLNGGLGRDHDRKILRSGKLMRLDFAGHYRVIDLDEPATWAVFPDRCARFPMPDAGTWPFFGLRDYQVERLPVQDAPEKETVDGHVCKIEYFSFVRSKSAPSTIKMKVWRAEDLNSFPVKLEVNNVERGRQYSITYTDVSLQSPDPKLFQHPTKCDSVSKPQAKKAGPSTRKTARAAAKASTSSKQDSAKP